jgi:hypothetical protein
MRRFIILFQITFILVAVLLYFVSYAQEVSSIELINNAKQYDNKNVVYRGEVVGDIMRRDRHAWLSINDGYSAIGIWISKELIEDIQYIGSYKAKGDIVEVSGLFNRSCPEHGGDLDIHAKTITKIASGYKNHKIFTTRKLHLSFLLLCMILLISLLKAKYLRSTKTKYPP